MHLNITLITYKQPYFLQNITLTTSILPFSPHKHRADPPANPSISTQETSQKSPISSNKSTKYHTISPANNPIATGRTYERPNLPLETT